MTTRVVNRKVSSNKVIYLLTCDRTHYGTRSCITSCRYISDDKTNEMFTIKSQQDIIIIVIMIMAYHKVVCKPNSYALQAKDQSIIWKNMISSYDSVMEFISAYNSVNFHILSVAMKSTVHT
jgi:hypothetical protein